MLRVGGSCFAAVLRFAEVRLRSRNPRSAPSRFGGWEWVEEMRGLQAVEHQKERTSFGSSPAVFRGCEELETASVTRRTRVQMGQRAS